MRTAKYNDYTLLRIVTFIILVILGLLAYKYFVKAPCEHTSEGKWVTVDATCTEDGYRYRVCNGCGEQVANLVISAKGHELNDIVIPIEKPTCTKTGTGYKACAVCDEHLESVVIPATEHKDGAVVIENEKEHTSTQGASYENVVYCTECDAELSREKVVVEHEVTTTVEKISDPTCTESGNEQTIVYCNDCEKQLSSEISIIEPTGHIFAWELASENGEFIFSGKCTATECDHNYDSEADSGYTFEVNKDENASVQPTCVAGYDIYVGVISLNGVKVANATVKIDLPADKNVNHTIITEDGKVVDIEEFAKLAKVTKDGEVVRIEDLSEVDYENETVFVYYNISNPYINLVYEREEGQTITEAMAAAWDENGFALGVFKCANDVTDEFEHWVTVKVYNDLAENDSIENDSAESDLA